MNRSSRTPVRLLAAVAALLLTLLTGAVLAPAASAATVPGDAWVRAAHLVPGLEAMDVVARAADGRVVQLAAGAGYGDVAPYERLAPGTYAAELRPAGAAADSAPVLSATVAVEAGRAYTLAGLGTLAAPRLAALTDDLTPPAAGQVRVRVLPAAEQAAEVSVQAVGGATIADRAAFGQPTAYASVPAGSWTLRAGAEGLPDATTELSLAAGGVYTVVVVDDGGTLDVRAVTDAAGMAAMPVGGADTGGGGTAADGSRPWAVVGLSLVGAALLLVVPAGRRLARRV